jgi:DNA (cytosine-5)-methyltransferase 1
VDAWPFAVDTYRRNFPRARAVELALHEKSLPTDLPGIGKIDLLLASPECTNHTCARGSRAPDEESKRTARYVLNFARELRPRWVVIENVIHMKGWHGYDSLVRELGRFGYNVLPQELDASQLGVSQKRRRLFLLCDRLATPRSVPLRSGKPRSGRSILDSPSRWKSRPVGTGTHAESTLERVRRGIAALGRGISFLVVYYGSDGAGGWHPLDRPIRTLTTLDRFGLVSWDGDTPMLRMLQVPELKRAMGFDDEFVLEEGSRRNRIKILGNGVCPPVMKAIVETLTGANASTLPIAAE